MRIVTVRDQGITPGSITLRVPERAAVLKAAHGLWGSSATILMGGRVIDFHRNYQQKKLYQTGCRRQGTPAPFPKGCRVEFV